MEAMELGQRAVKCKHWRWMAGMLSAQLQLVCVGVSQDGHPLFPIRSRGTYPTEHRQSTPDLRYSATLGCLMVMLREAYGDNLVITQGSDWWSVETDDRCWDCDNTGSLVEALVLALEAAP